MDQEIFSYANLGNAAFLEGIYQKYLENPEQVDPSWQSFFSGMAFAKEAPLPSEENNTGDTRIFRLVEAYKEYGHKKVAISPFQQDIKDVPELSLSTFGLTADELSMQVPSFGITPGATVLLSQLIDALEKRFCAGIGFEVPQAFEKEGGFVLDLPKEARLKILEDLIQAEVFELFIHTKYPGQIRFSLEGGETLIPLLNALIEKGADFGLDEFVIGMPHRGRLSVLANVLNKPYHQIFEEFEDLHFEEGSGDVKYHKGAHSVLETTSGKSFAVCIPSNASHLESVNPVVEGRVRALQDLRQDPEAKKQIAPILIHGDASIAGQGVVYETLQMAKLEGYNTGGTIHIVVNNQIGYTTLPKEGRSTPYCTDIAKAFGCPIFHVNADRPEDCIAAALFALQIRQTFHVDVFIDLNCYRKYGHNEGDEPSFTQPLEYKEIKSKESIRILFEKQLLKEGILTKEEVEKKEKEFKDRLQETLSQVIESKKEESKEHQKPRASLKADLPDFSKETASFLVEKICTVPASFSIHPKLRRLLKERHRALEEPSEKVIDWGMGEHMAYGSLLLDGITLRLSGQDVARGTFSHRHAVFIDQKTAERYTPLSHLKQSQAPCFIYNSFLSEFAVMGFDLGYSHSHPTSLVLWEAQFGDFVNGAQIVIDQYLSTSEQKWNRNSNLTLLLPHGYEGKGPEHSSARMERFLQMAAEDNLIIAYCTTPAQFFHLIRRQGHLQVKKPLILFTSKLLLRHPSCVSSLKELEEGSFQECLEEPSLNKKAKKIILCSGKVFYDCVKEKEERGKEEFALIRIEQLYPFPKQKLVEALSRYLEAEEIIWLQEESKNMGAWSYIQGVFLEEKPTELPLRYVGRKESASPATGSYSKHKKQYEAFMNELFKD